MSRILTLALLAALSLTACRQEAAPPPAAPKAEAPAVAEQPAVAPAADAKPGATLSVSTVDTGTSVGADGRVVTALETFKSSDTIVAAITLSNSGATPVKGMVTARWLGPDGKPFNEESQQRDFAGNQTLNFRVADPKGLAPGNYKLEVALNGSTVQTREFSVH